MKRWIGIVLLMSSIVGCSYKPVAETSNGAQLQKELHNCINQAEGSPEKLSTCQSILDELKKDKEHEYFAQRETVRVFDYQKCIAAMKMGNDQEVKTRCDRIWQEIRGNSQ